MHIAIILSADCRRYPERMTITVARSIKISTITYLYWVKNTTSDIAHYWGRLTRFRIQSVTTSLVWYIPIICPDTRSRIHPTQSE